VTDFNRVCVQFDADPRFAAALEGGAASQLQSAVIAACESVFQRLPSDHTKLTVTFTRHVDRIEVAISHDGEAAGTRSPGPPSTDGVDHVQFESKAGRSVVLLTKFLVQGAPKL
jgi:hypothetical protein